MSTPAAASAPVRVPTLAGLLRLAWPIVISRSSQVVVGVSDAVLVGHLGEAALAATTTGALNAFTLLIMPMGLVFIVSSFSSQLHGAGDTAGARRYGFYGLAVALATQVVALLTMAFVPTLLGRLGYAPEVRHLMIDYLALRLLSAGPAIGIEALANYYGGLGNTRLPMLASVGAMVLNVLGNLLLIDGRLGAPALGVRGSALASTLATTFAFAVLLAIFLGEGRSAAGGGRMVPALRLAELGNMLRFGLPSGFNWFFEFVAYSFFINVVVGGLGTTALAAMMTVMQINSVSFMPAFGLASAGAIVVGQLIGAGRHDEVPRALGITMRGTLVWQGAIGLTYLLIPRTLLAPFVKDADSAAALFDAGARMLVLSSAWQLFDGVVSSYSEALRAAGDTSFPLWVRVGIAWLIFAPGSYLTVRRLGGGVEGAVLWLVLYLGLLSVVLVLRFRSGAWRRLRLLPPEAPAPL
jgi:MATE family multidrug resistance protein